MNALATFYILMIGFVLAMADDTCHSSDDSSCVADSIAMSSSATQNVESKLDASGGFYLFALAMGRYGNQMEHLLGALAEAKRRSPNRILVLPSFVTWRFGHGQKNAHIPVEYVFRLDRLREFHSNIVSYTEFRDMISSSCTGSTEQKWKAKQATIYCSSEWKRYTHFECLNSDIDQEGTYWHSLGIQFVKEQWHEEDVFNLDPKYHPVVAVGGALSAPFPMRKQDRYVAKYLQWTELMEERRRSFLAQSGMSDHDLLVAAHLRAGSDWVKACESALGNEEYMASPQCSDEMQRKNMTDGITLELCLPTSDRSAVANDLLMVARKVLNNASDIKDGTRLILFFASDVADLGKGIMAEFDLDRTYDYFVTPPAQPEISTRDGIEALIEDASFLDLIVMTHADYLVGNCVSSFTSFAARIRTEQGIGFGTEFFGLVDDA